MARVADAIVTCPKTHPQESGPAEIRACFEDDHVHMALIVPDDGRLVATIERPDPLGGGINSTPVSQLGTLRGRGDALDVAPVAENEALVRAASIPSRE